MLMTAQFIAGLLALVLATSFLAGVLGMAGGMILMGLCHVNAFYLLLLSLR
jgi:hypothetical protein